MCSENWTFLSRMPSLPRFFSTRGRQSWLPRSTYSPAQLALLNKKVLDVSGLFLWEVSCPPVFASANVARIKMWTLFWPRGPGNEWLMDAPVSLCVWDVQFPELFSSKVKSEMKEALQGLLPPCISGSQGFSAPHLNIKFSTYTQKRLVQMFRPGG